MQVSAHRRYFKVLIQEMDLKLDLGFLYAILDMFNPEDASTMTLQQEVRYTHSHPQSYRSFGSDSWSCLFVLVLFLQVELFEKDIEYIKTQLNQVSAADTSAISLYEYFHISPIKVCAIWLVFSQKKNKLKH